MAAGSNAESAIAGMELGGGAFEGAEQQASNRVARRRARCHVMTAATSPSARCQLPTTRAGAVLWGFLGLLHSTKQRSSPACLVSRLHPLASAAGGTARALHAAHQAEYVDVWGGRQGGGVPLTLRSPQRYGAMPCGGDGAEVASLRRVLRPGAAVLQVTGGLRKPAAAGRGGRAHPSCAQEQVVSGAKPLDEQLCRWLSFCSEAPHTRARDASALTTRSPVLSGSGAVVVFEADENFILMDRMPVDGGAMERQVTELMENGPAAETCAMRGTAR
eukprot:scaffold1572_cov329-Prasinococcus_capsulatus_cf.AAC.5